MSKPGTIRWRYVAFVLEGRPVSRRDVADALKKGSAARLELTRFGYPHGIARAPHTDLAALRQAVEGLAMPDVTVRTLSTSGTIRTLTHRLGILRERRKGLKPSKRGPSRGKTS